MARTISKMQIRSSLEIEDFLELQKLADKAGQNIPDYLRLLIVKHINVEVTKDGAKEKPEKTVRRKKGRK